MNSPYDLTTSNSFPMQKPISCEVAVIGAGLSGLAAMDYLVDNGVDAKLFEAQGYAGGRVFTRHTQSGGHYEEGAFSFTDIDHTLWKYIDRFTLKTIQLSQIDKQFYFQGEIGHFSDEKKNLRLEELLSQNPSQEDESLALHLKEEGISERNIQWIRENTLIGLFGDSFEELSLKSMIHFFSQYIGATKSYSLKGGNDQLPKAMANHLKDRIYYNCPIKRVLNNGTSVVLEGDRKITAQRVIFAIPLAALKSLEITPPLSEEKQEAILSVPYTSSSRSTFKGPTGILGKPLGGVFATSDSPSGWYRDQTLLQSEPNQETVFNFSSIGKEARRMSQLSENERDKEVFQGLKIFKPDLKEDELESSFFSWDNVEWVKGGYSYFPTGKFPLLKELAKPEGPFHFVGEHTTPHFASMNGALDSGIRGAKEVISSLSSQVGIN